MGGPSKLDGTVIGAPEKEEVSKWAQPVHDAEAPENAGPAVDVLRAIDPKDIQCELDDFEVGRDKVARRDPARQRGSSSSNTDRDVAEVGGMLCCIVTAGGI